MGQLMIHQILQRLGQAQADRLAVAVCAQLRIIQGVVQDVAQAETVVGIAKIAAQKPVKRRVQRLIVESRGGSFAIGKRIAFAAVNDAFPCSAEGQFTVQHPVFKGAAGFCKRPMQPTGRGGNGTGSQSGQKITTADLMLRHSGSPPPFQFAPAAKAAAQRSAGVRSTVR